jgi:hypothetical protein
MSTPFRQQQSGIRATRIDGLKNGLKIRGSGWIPVVPERRQKVENTVFSTTCRHPRKPLEHSRLNEARSAVTILAAVQPSGMLEPPHDRLRKH